jgi:hypothetical protein
MVAGDRASRRRFFLIVDHQEQHAVRALLPAVQLLLWPLFAVLLPCCSCAVISGK